MQRISITNPQNIIDGTAKKYYFKLRNTGGPKGDKGDKGDTGSRGPQGEPGNAATVSVGSTTTLPVGYNATVTNTGSIYNAVLNFGIPQGPRGPQGVKGDPGEPGQKGEPGPRGIQGERGTNATVSIGTTSTLNPGTQATVYNSGTDSNAVLNFGIPKGDKGDKGDTGPMPTIAQTTGQAADQVMSQKATTDGLNTKQATITNSNKLSADLVTDTTTTNKFVTAEDKTTWNAKQNALTAGQGIDITSDVISTPALVPEVVASLPAEGTEGKLYLTPKAHTTQTATGNPITATVAEEAGALESFQLDGDTYQQSYTGKNRAGVRNTAQFADHGLTVSVEGDVITLDGTANAVVSICLADYNLSGMGDTKPAVTVFPISGSWTSGAIGISLRNSSDSQIFFQQARYDGTLFNANTLSESTLAAADHAYIFAGATTVFSNFKCKFMLSTSSTLETTYEPYTGGQPSPNPDYPQPIQTVTGEQTVTVEGKNLFNKDSYQVMDAYFNTGTATITYNDSNRTLYIPCEPNTTYTVSKRAGAVFNVGYTDSLPAIGTSVNGIQGGSSSPSQTLTTGANAKYLVCRFYQSAQDTITQAQMAASIQIEKSDTATTYAPYRATSYPINLGKNLFSSRLVQGYYAFADGNYSPNSSSYVTSEDKIPVEAGQTYTISASKGVYKGSDYTGAGVVFFNNGTYVSSILRPENGTFTVPKGANQVIYNFYKGSSDSSITPNDIAWVQLELGPTASSYAPYFTPIELCKLGTYQDYIWKDGDDWKVHKAVQEITLGNLTWRSATEGDTTNGFSAYVSLAGQQKNNPALSNSFSVIEFNNTDHTLHDFIMIGINTLILNIKRSKLSEETIGGLVAWLKANGSVAYVLHATPIDTVITNQNLIAQLEAIRTASLENGTNTIANNTPAPNLAGDMEIGYYGYNPRNRYDKFIWLDLNNAYEQLNNPDTSSTRSTRSLATTAEQPTVARSLGTETITLKKGEAEPIEEKTELPTILDEEAEETETAEPEESDGADER